MKKLLLAVAMVIATSPAFAKNFAVPAKDPIATIAIPDTWETEEIQYGYSAKPPSHDAFFSVEYATGARVDKMLKLNDEWLKENNIKADREPVQKAISIDGIESQLLTVIGKDEDGPTIVDFVFIPAGKDRLI
eukprot:gene31282-35699_t